MQVFSADEASSSVASGGKTKSQVGKKNILTELNDKKSQSFRFWCLNKATTVITLPGHFDFVS